MKINFYGKDIKVTEQMEEYAEKKLSVLERYLHNIIDVRVEFREYTAENSGKKFFTEVTIAVPGQLLRADEAATTIFEATDLVVPKLKKQAERYKEKHTNKRG